MSSAPDLLHPPCSGPHPILDYRPECSQELSIHTIGRLTDLREAPAEGTALHDRPDLHYLLREKPLLVTNAAALAGALAVVVFLALYMSVSSGLLVSGFLRLVPPEKRERAGDLLRTIEGKLRGWIVAVAAISLFIDVGSGVGLWAMGIPLPITFGLIAGVLNVVPYLGSTVGALLPVLVALSISPLKALLVAALFVALNRIEGYLLQPLVMGHEVSLHPVTVIVSFLILGTLLGVLGRFWRSRRRWSSRPCWRSFSRKGTAARKRRSEPDAPVFSLQNLHWIFAGY